MRKVFLLFSIVIYSANISFGQFAKEYQMSFANSRLKSLLCIYHNGQYYLTITESEAVPIFDGLFDDVEAEFFLSKGNVLINENSIILRDTIQKYEMVVKNDNDTSLMIVHSFGLLRGKHYLRLSDESYFFDESENLIMSKWDTLDIKKKEKNHVFAHENSRLLKNGEYTSKEYDYQDSGYYTLNISNNDRYILHYKLLRSAFVLSEGTWKRQGNILILHDTCLNHSFHLLIGGNKLVSNLLPGDYYGVTLHYQNK